jgi:hypothetical protein
MLDFFKDMYYEVSGIEKPIKKKEDKIIFSKSAKIIICCMGVLYLGVGTIMISNCIDSGNYLSIFKYVFLIILDIAANIFMFMKTKKAEQIAFILVVLFIAVNYLTSIF